MSDDRDDFLVRLRDDPDEAPELRESLVREAAVRVAFDESKGLARLYESLGDRDLAKAERSPTRAARRWATSILPLSGLVILIGGASVGLRWYGAEEASAPPVASPAATVAPTAESSEPIAGPFVPTLAVELLPHAPSSDSSSSVARSAPAFGSARTKPSRSSPDSVSNPLEETLHLGELRQVAATDPERALSMVQEGNRRFAAGSFREEREAIAIGALARLGRRVEAKRAGEAFLVTYPTSPFAPNVRRAAGL
jgi:hypothetical protein